MTLEKLFAKPQVAQGRLPTVNCNQFFNLGNEAPKHCEVSRGINMPFCFLSQCAQQLPKLVRKLVGYHRFQSVAVLLHSYTSEPSDCQECLGYFAQHTIVSRQRFLCHVCLLCIRSHGFITQELPFFIWRTCQIPEYYYRVGWRLFICCGLAFGNSLLICSCCTRQRSRLRMTKQGGTRMENSIMQIASETFVMCHSDNIQRIKTG